MCSTLCTHRKTTAADVTAVRNLGSNQIVLLLCSFLLGCARLAFAADSLIVFPERVGGVTAHSTEAELAKIYGKENLTRGLYPCGDGGECCATVLFKNSEREVRVIWNGNDGYSSDPSPEEQKNCETLAPRRSPAGVSLTTDFEKEPAQNPTYWRTPEGVFVGISLLELERMNASPIEFESSPSCFDGGITNWNKGKLEKLTELLEYSRLAYPLEEVEKFKTSSTVSSKDLPASLKKKIFLANIEFSFPNSDSR